MELEPGKSYLAISAEGKSREEFLEGIAKRLKVEKVDIAEFESSGGVEALRKFASGAFIKPYSSAFKMLVIYGGDTLSSEEANTLLKTIEEPPKYVLIIIFASNASMVIPTIKSRCLRLQIEANSIEDEAEIFINSLELNFNEFLAFIKNIESSKIPDMLKITLKEIRRRGMSLENVELYKRIAEDYMRISSTNSNPRLALEGIYIWNKANRAR